MPPQSQILSWVLEWSGDQAQDSFLRKAAFWWWGHEVKYLKCAAEALALNIMLY